MKQPDENEKIYEKIKREYGIFFISFGEDVTDEMQGKVLRNMYDALGQLKDILGVPARTLSLDGQLAVFIGFNESKGGLFRYGGLPAVYINNPERDLSVCGQFAHEMTHALDIGLIWQQEDVTFAYLDLLARLGDERTQFYQGARWCQEHIKRAGEQKYITSFVSDKVTKLPELQYYTNPHEMLARAIDYYIALKMEERGMQNLFLCKPMERYRSPENAKKFPTPDEAEEIGRLFCTVLDRTPVLYCTQSLLPSEYPVNTRYTEGPIDYRAFTVPGNITRRRKVHSRSTGIDIN